MLQKIFIKNFAIIEELQLELPNGLIALTGETGAGKSIILGAINLLLGARADSNSLYNKEDKCIVEAEFSIAAIPQIKSLLQTIEVDAFANNQLIIRREISAAGRSRAFINDTPVLLNQLQDVGETLIDLHRQFDVQDVKEQNFQLAVLDTLAKHEDVLNNYKNVYNNWLHTKQEIIVLKETQTKLQQEQDYNQFIFEELDKYSWQINEIETLEEQLQILSRAEELKQSLQQANNEIADADDAVLVKLKKILQGINPYTTVIKTIQPITDRLNQLIIELKDIQSEIETLEETVDVDKEKLNVTLDKFNEGTRLLKKHRLIDTNALIEYKNTIQNKIIDTNSIAVAIKNKEDALAQLHIQAAALANTLSNNRNKIAKKATDTINNQLLQVGMPNARFNIIIENTTLNITGIDNIKFLLDANNTNKFLPIYKAASGGELSRLMLCIKNLLANATHLPTLIFDEIDTGISGEVAKKVGLLMKNMSANHQLITVTHLPQIAAKASHHLFVYKLKNNNGILQTQVKLLSNAERINHIAEMLSGSSPTATAIETAKELMAQ